MSKEKQKEIEDLKSKLTPILEKMIGKLLKYAGLIRFRPFNSCKARRPSSIYAPFSWETNWSSYKEINDGWESWIE